VTIVVVFLLGWRVGRCYESWIMAGELLVFYSVTATVHRPRPPAPAPPEARANRRRSSYPCASQPRSSACHDLHVLGRYQPELAREDEGADTRVRIRPWAPLRSAVFAASRRRWLRQQVRGGTGTHNMFAGLGFAARGIAYIVIGVIAVMMAFGVARHEADRAGGHRGNRRQAVRISLL
jgi:hypothetical protein